MSNRTLTVYNSPTHFRCWGFLFKMSNDKERIPLTEEDIIDLYEDVENLRNSLEALFGILYDNTELSPELKDEIYQAYIKKF